jgi:hypothetical protein
MSKQRHDKASSNDPFRRQEFRSVLLPSEKQQQHQQQQQQHRRPSSEENNPNRNQRLRMLPNESESSKARQMFTYEYID